MTMSYIVQRNQHFYVVAYNDCDPITGQERRRRHRAGSNRCDAEAIQQRLDAQLSSRPCQRSLGGFMSTTWLDANTARTPRRWQRRLNHEGATIDSTTPMFLNRHHRTPSPESFSQLFTRSVAATQLPRIRFHDLRHTHASLLVAAGVSIKVVSERLGHAHPGFTMHTYQHLLPGMGAAAAGQFAQLIDANR